MMGLRKFKKNGEMAVTQELNQIHDLQTFILINAES